MAHPAAAAPQVRLEDLADEPFVTYPGDVQSTVRQAVSATCADHGFVPLVAMEATETATLISYVAAGTGVALVPESASQMTVTGAVYRPLIAGSRPVELAMAWRKDDELPVLHRTIQVIRDELAAIRAGRSTWADGRPVSQGLVA